MNDRARSKGRMAIYAMAGVYLLFMAHSLFKNLNTSSGNEKILMIIFMIFFVVVGAAMVIMGLVKGYKLSQPSGGYGFQDTEKVMETEEDLLPEQDAMEEKREE